MKPPAELPILLHTPDVVAVDKPAGLAAIPGRGEPESVLSRLAAQLGLPDRGATDPRLRVVHRIDKQTSGVLLFARHLEAQRALSHQFQNNRVEKQYLAIVVGAPRDDAGIIDAPIGVHPTDRTRMAVLKKGGRPAVTEWRVERRFRGYALVRCLPRTGKTHQIRVHLAHLGHPLAVDALYNPPRGARAPNDPPPVEGLFLSSIKRGYRQKRDRDERPLIGRLTLHAAQITFESPSGERITVSAELPRDFRAAVNQLGKTR